MSFAQWERISTTYVPSTITSSGANLFIGYSGKVYRSSNNGTNFIQVGNINSDVVYLVANNNFVFAGTNSGGIGGFYWSTNAGDDWTQTYMSPVYNIATSTNDLYMVSNHYIFRSTNNGQSFMQTGSPQHPGILCANSSGSIIYAGYPGNVVDPAGGIYRTNNSGSTWERIKILDSLAISDVKTDDNYIYVTTKTNVQKKGSIWISPDEGVSWVQKQLLYRNYYGYNTICVVNGNLFVGSDSGLFLSKDHGNNWSIKHEGFVIDNNPVRVIKIFHTNGYLYASVADGSSRGLYRALVETIDVKKISSEVPSNFSLSQNYPNPFNPTTSIQYKVSKETTVSIKVFDIGGREIETLVNDKHSPGIYEVNWNAAKYSSGVYFYKLETENFSETKKMILVK